MKREEKSSLGTQWRLLIRGIRIWGTICPQFLIFNTLCRIAEMLIPYFSLCMTTRFVNELSGSCRREQLIYLAAFSVLGVLVLNMTKRILEGRREVWRDSCLHRVGGYLSDRQNRMEYRHLEDADVALLREEIFIASDTNGSGLWRIAWVLPNLIGNLFDLAVSLSLTCSMFRTAKQVTPGSFSAFVNSPGCAVLFFILLILNLTLAVKTAGRHTAREMEAWSLFAKDMVALRAYLPMWGEDITVFNLKELIMKEYEKASIRPAWLTELEKINIRYGSIMILLDALLGAAVFLVTAAKAFIGVFGIGSFILYRGTVSRFVKAFSEIAVNITHLCENSGYLLKLYRFLDLPEDMYQGSLAVEKRDDIDYEIEFRNVSFRYPGSDVWALKNVSMKLKIGQKLAIVGENGSGKTTFIKLLCRLYDPAEGVILLNGIDITRYRYEEYMSLFSVVFQDFNLFAFSLAENVAGSGSYDGEKVKKCLIQAGFEERLKTLPDGIQSVIGRDYENDGIDLSGGEAQKIALARALYKDAPFMVLDEPTAALDPMAEAAVYESFQRLVRNKTAVFISHRLSSCRFCDDIIVFHKGSLVQRGKHDVLAEEEGKYRELWTAQAKYYN